MARKKIREYDSKRLLKAHIARLAGLNLPINVAQVKESTNFAELIAQNNWMTQASLFTSFFEIYSHIMLSKYPCIDHSILFTPYFALF